MKTTPSKLHTVGLGGLLDTYRSTGECRVARQLLAEGASRRREQPIAFSGFHGGALAFFLSCALTDDNGPTMIVTAGQDEAENLRDELSLFSGRDSLFFPPWESLFRETSEPDREIHFDRLVAMRHLDRSAPGRLSFVITPITALLQPIAAAEEVAGATLRVEREQELPRDELAARLLDLGFRHVPLVLARGEYSVRGDIVDVFPFDAPFPCRVELFGNRVDSIREFDAESQRSIPEGTHESCSITSPLRESMFRACFTGEEPLLIDRLPETSWVMILEPTEVADRMERMFASLLPEASRLRAAGEFRARMEERPLAHFSSLAVEVGATSEGRGLELGFASVERFKNEDLERTMSELAGARERGHNVTVLCENEGERQRVEAILDDHGLPADRQTGILIGSLKRGFQIGSTGEVVLTTQELFNRRPVRRRRHVEEAQVVRGFFELEAGDYVVHVAHGIGRYRGVRLLRKEGVTQEFLELEYRGGVKVYVPATKIDLVQKYVGTGDAAPALDKVGGVSWGKRRAEVEEAIEDFAAELLEVQALREEKSGVSYPDDGEWQRQFEASFPYEDTPDQAEATSAVKEDLRSSRPMDRLLCGDVGYGKTEVAMRAAFKVVEAGKQVGVLVPTTVLAQQHARTFQERFAGFPIHIAQISRFCTRKEQREIVAATAAGEVDILIGTHRLLSDDVRFADLGLVIIDEEQRFGVAHKEKLKKMRALVELLTLTATPIPRTLHMALLGIRDISSLTTPPEGRSPIVTEVIEFDRRRVREAILRELDREGQVYFVHNRVQDIARLRSELQALTPEARIEFAHGQMSEHQLEEIMVRFLDRQIDVLVCTTIIETGIDIPNVNTIFIDECDRFGLSGLHQLRGRVGRSRHKAYCYLILPDRRHLNPDARKRLATIREFSELGAGFRIALRDLEIRGAGNILGARQSGHIAQIGYDLYCRLLEKAVKSRKNQRVDDAVDVEVDLNLEAFIPDDHVPDERVRLDVYRRLSKARTIPQVEEIAEELADRCGSLAPPVRRMLEIQIFRILAIDRGIRGVRRDGATIILRGDEAMRTLLDSCPHRCVILSPNEVAIVLGDGPGGQIAGDLDDPRVFEILFQWFKTGTFPSLARRRGARARRG